MSCGEGFITYCGKIVYVDAISAGVTVWLG
jgi:hypothetical protein